MTEILDRAPASDRAMRILVVNPSVGSEAGRLLARDGHDVLELASEDSPVHTLGVFADDCLKPPVHDAQIRARLRAISRHRAQSEQIPTMLGGHA